MKVAFIGLGIMGSRMAANLMAHGHMVIVHNRTREKADALVQQGAAWAETPAAAVLQADLVITMLAHPEAVQAAALGENGFLEGMPSGRLWVDCSTVNPSFSREMAQAAVQRGVRFVDAPVAGSKMQAEKAELAFLVGGDVGDVEYIQPVLQAMGQRVVHVGANGAGTALKVVVNMLLGVSMAAFAEGVALGRSLGLSEEVLHNVLIGGPVVAPFVAGKKGKFTTRDYEADFPLQWMHKDLHLATVTAYETGTHTLLAAMAKELYALALRGGHSDQDFSALYEYLNS
ncbi:MAG: NAD(P)-dependent oxidoreductase [Anaerolineae bacterium]